MTVPLNDNQEMLVYWITEREKIREKKEKGEPKPWSDDPVFQKTYFCNVHREDDRVTKWIRQNWSIPYANHDNIEFATVLSRFINKPETLQVVEFPQNLQSCVDNIIYYEEFCRQYDQRFWGNAYVITTHGIHMPKVLYLTQRVLPMAYECVGAGNWRSQYPAPPRTLAARHGQLMRLEGMGSFLSAQVIADLKNTPDHPLRYASDWWTWSAWGPGSLRGLSWFFNQPVSPIKYERAIELVNEYVVKHLPKGFEMISMQDLQNCLCEYDKYMRVATNAGRSKRLYNGR